jgi:hypothetical protein
MNMTSTYYCAAFSCRHSGCSTGVSETHGGLLYFTDRRWQQHRGGNAEREGPIRQFSVPAGRLWMAFGADAASGNGILDRAGALDKAAGYVQKMYWAQFADDTYHGGGGGGEMMLPKKKQTQNDLEKQSISSPDNDNDNTNDNTNGAMDKYARIPRAATPEPLLPATGVRYQINAIAQTLNEYYHTGDDDLARREKDLDRIGTVLNNSPELSSTRAVRTSFNTYTQAIRFGQSFQINLPQGSKERRRYLQDNDTLQLLTAETIITADLDLRDLHRNQILTNVDDLRAEVAYLQRMRSPADAPAAKEEDVDELQRIVETLVAECDTWFGFIPPPDVDAAYVAFVNDMKREDSR